MATAAHGRSHAGRPWVLVRVAASRLAIHSDHVREMLALPPVSRLPGLPHDALGVITWRGRVVAAIDLAARLGLPRGFAEEPAAGPRMAIVVAVGAHHFALVVDAVEGVEALAAGSVAPLPMEMADSSRPVREHARTARDDSLVLLLDVATLLEVGQARPDPFWTDPGPAGGRAVEVTAADASREPPPPGEPPDTTPAPEPPPAETAPSDAASERQQPSPKRRTPSAGKPARKAPAPRASRARRDRTRD